MPHSIINGYKRVLAVAVETDYTFPLAEKVMAGSDLPLRGVLKMQPGTFTETPCVSPSLKELGPACVRGTCPEKGFLLPHVVCEWQEKGELPSVPSCLGLLHLSVAEMSLILHTWQ